MTINIFYLSKDQKKIAKLMTNKHIVKMVLETAQLLSSAHQVMSPEPIVGIYKLTHKNHPCSIWVRESTENYLWTFKLFEELANEYKARYNREHKSWLDLHTQLSKVPVGITNQKFTEPPQAMPEQYKHKSTKRAYTNYYIQEKLKTSEDMARFYKYAGSGGSNG